MDITKSSLNYTSSYFVNQNQGGGSDLSNEDDKKDGDTQKPKSELELSADEQRVVYELQARDTEVRAHEAAHQAAGGGMTGGANYSYERGPDGKMYAVGGEVSISMPGGSTPQEVISNAQQVIAAALAPANPSSQDMSVAASARALMVQAQQEKAKESYEEMTNTGDKEKNEESNLDISA